MGKANKKRLSITLPADTIQRLNDLVPRLERGAIVAYLIEDYLDELEAAYEHEERVEARRRKRQAWLESLRASGQKAADLFLP